MDFGSDRMAGPMDKTIAETVGFDVSAGRVIHLVAPDFNAGICGLLNRPDGLVSSITHDLEYLLDPLGRLSTETVPGDVVKDRAGLVEPRPHVEQDEIAGPDRPVGFG